MEAKELINWGNLSRTLCGSRMTLRRNKIPKKHLIKINNLIKAIDNVMNEGNN